MRIDTHIKHIDRQILKFEAEIARLKVLKDFMTKQQNAHENEGIVELKSK